MLRNNEDKVITIIYEEISDVDFSKLDNKDIILLINIHSIIRTKFTNYEKLEQIRETINKYDNKNPFFLALLELINNTLLSASGDGIDKIEIKVNDPDSLDKNTRYLIQKVLEQVIANNETLNITTDRYYFIEKEDRAKIKVKFNSPLIPQFDPDSLAFTYKWRVLSDRIGGGNFGDVFKQGATYSLKGVNEKNELIIKKVAKNLKVIKMQKETSENFSHEMSILKSLNKKFYPTDKHNTSFSLDEIEGVSVSKIGELSIEEYLNLFKYSLIELMKLHSLGYTHNDIHDGNILFNRQNGWVALIDFGRAKFYTVINAEEEKHDMKALALFLLSALKPKVSKDLLEASLKKRNIEELKKHTHDGIIKDNITLDSLLNIINDIYFHKGCGKDWLEQLSAITTRGLAYRIR